MEIFIVVAALILIAALGVFFRLRKNKKSVVQPPVPIPTVFSLSYFEPGCPSVYSNVNVPQAALDTLKAGLEKMIRLSSAARGWVELSNPEDYTIYFIPPMATNQVDDPGSPAILVTDGLGHQVQAAGTTLGVGYDVSANRPVIVLPDQEATGWSVHLPYLFESVRNEGEHYRGWICDKTWFWQFTGAADLHPQFPDENGG